MKILTYKKDFHEICELLKTGAVGVLPTDTVYGLVAAGSDKQAVERLYALKHREQKPGTLIAANTDQLRALGVSQSEINKVAQWWPKPLSAVLPASGNEYLHQGVGTLAMRVVADETIRKLLEQTGPLMTSSANQPGEAPAASVQEAILYFGGTVDFYVDSGVVKNILPSTIIRPTPNGIEVLRQGSITLK